MGTRLYRYSVGLLASHQLLDPRMPSHLGLPALYRWQMWRWCLLLTRLHSDTLRAIMSLHSTWHKAEILLTRVVTVGMQIGLGIGLFIFVKVIAEGLFMLYWSSRSYTHISLIMVRGGQLLKTTETFCII